MYRWDIINYFIKKYKFTKYLEIGLDNGQTFNTVSCNEKTSVDPALGQYSHANPTFKMTSDDFFKSIDGSRTWDIIFIDGLHHADQVYRDINNSLRHLSDNGVIICHDMNPVDEMVQRVPRQTKKWNGDCWKAWVRMRSQRDDLYMKVIDTDEGLGIIRKNSTNALLDIPDRLRYSFLAENRKYVLNLIDIETFFDEN